MVHLCRTRPGTLEWHQDYRGWGQGLVRRDRTQPERGGNPIP